MGCGSKDPYYLRMLFKGSVKTGPFFVLFRLFATLHTIHNILKIYFYAESGEQWKRLSVLFRAVW
jgi:hypothetical protein